MRSTSVGGVAAVLVLGAALLAQDAGQAPVFRSGVDLITVDVAVVRRDGTPQRGLSPDEFDVRIDGTPRRVVSAEYVAHRGSGSSEGARSGYFTSNEETDAGRLVLIAVDQQHIRRLEGRSALKAASNFIAALDRADRVAAAPLDYIGPIQFTDDHTSVRRYVERLTGEATSMPSFFNIGLAEALAIADGAKVQLDQVVLRECGERLANLQNPARAAENEGLRDPCPTQIEQESRAMAQMARTQSTMAINALARLIARLAEIEGPKTLVLVSEGLVAEPRLVELSALGAAAQAAQVTLYILQPETPVFEASQTALSPSHYDDLQLQNAGLARLAGSARGSVFRIVGDDPYPFDRILREMSGYYLLGVEAEPTDRDGRVRRIAVSVRGSGLTVRARPHFRAPPAPAAETTANTLVTLLRTPRLATELPLRVATYTYQAPESGRLSVVLGAEIEADPGREATLAYVLVNDRGIIVSSAAAETVNGRFSSRVNITPGEYVLKVAAVGAAGRRGSVERRFAASLAPGAVRTSELMIAEPPATPEGTLQPAVYRIAAAHVVGYLEIYAAPGSGWKPDGGSVVLELLSDHADGPVVRVDGTIEPIEDGRWAVRGELPLNDAEPGRYIARAHVELPGKGTERLTRGFRLEKRR